MPGAAGAGPGQSECDDGTMEELFKSLASGGVTGAILAIILFKIAPAVKEQGELIRAEMRRMQDELRKMEDAIDRATRADLIRIVASPHVLDSVKDAATVALVEVEAAISDRSQQRRLNAPPQDVQK